MKHTHTRAWEQNRGSKASIPEAGIWLDVSITYTYDDTIKVDPQKAKELVEEYLSEAVRNVVSPEVKTAVKHYTKYTKE